MPCRRHVAQLRREKARLDDLHTKVFVLTFNGREDWAQQWLSETKSPFPMLLDSDKIAYDAYGLKQSILRSWSPRTLLYYAKHVLQGGKLNGAMGDPNQLGGDFIVAPDGTIRLAYYSDDPTDRPELDHIFDILGAIPQAQDS